jgi:hypothetical protein
MLWPWGWWETCSSTQACLIIFILGGLHQRGASRVRIHRIQTTLVARQREYFWIFWMVFCAFLISLTPLAGPILCGGNLSPNLHARFCKLYPADFSVAIYLFLCSYLSWFVCVSFSSTFPPGFFQTGSDAFPAAPSARALDATTHREKSLRHSVQVTRSLISIFGEIPSLILQALTCRFFGCNLLVFVFLAFMICLCFV